MQGPEVDRPRAGPVGLDDAEPGVARPEGSSASARDDVRSILEQRARQLESSERRCRELLLRMSDAVLLVTSDGRVRFANGAAADLLGLARDELVGHPFGVPLVAGERTEIDLRTPGGGHRSATLEVFDTEWEGRPARMAFLYELAASDVMDDPPAPLPEALSRAVTALNAVLEPGAVVAGLDRAARELLRCDATELWRYSAEADAFVRAPGDHGLGRAVLARTWSASAAHDPVVVTGDSLDGAAGGRTDGAGAGRCLLAMLRRRDQPLAVLVARYGAGAAPPPAWARIARSLADAAAVALDNAERLQAMMARERTRSDVFATVSHELRTPLNVILGYQEMLVDGALGSLTPAQLDKARRVLRSARLLADVIAGTLDVTRMVTGLEAVTLAPTDLAEVLAEVQEDTADLQERSGLEVRWPEPTGPVWVHTDRHKIRTVVRNLLGNALKYTDRGGVTITLEADGDAGAVVAVRDSGVGISPALLGAIFEPFYQVGAGGGRRDGVGLGLYIVRRLVDAIGGRVSVESVPGGGSTFRVWVPARPSRADA